MTIIFFLYSANKLLLEGRIHFLLPPLPSLALGFGECRGRYLTEVSPHCYTHSLLTQIAQPPFFNDFVYSIATCLRYLTEASHSIREIICSKTHLWVTICAQIIPETSFRHFGAQIHTPQGLSPRPNRGPHPHLPLATVSFHPEPKGGGHTRLRVRVGGGGPNSDDWSKA